MCVRVGVPVAVNVCVGVCVCAVVCLRKLRNYQLSHGRLSITRVAPKLNHNAKYTITVRKMEREGGEREMREGKQEEWRRERGLVGR